MTTPPDKDNQTKPTGETLSGDPGKDIMRLLCAKIIEQLQSPDPEIAKPALFEVARKLLSDNSITLAQVRRGDFGDVAKKVAEEFPFEDNGEPRQTVQ